MIGFDSALTPVIEPGVEEAVHTETFAPPLFALAVKAIEAEVELMVIAVPIDGASGTPTGVTELDELDAGLVPSELVQVTLKL